MTTFLLRNVKNENKLIIYIQMAIELLDILLETGQNRFFEVEYSAELEILLSGLFHFPTKNDFFEGVQQWRKLKLKSQV